MNFKYLLTSISLFALLSMPSLHGQDKEKPMDGKKNFGFIRGMSFSKSPKTTYPLFSKVTTGMTSKRGLFTLYQKGEQLYGLVKHSQMKRPFFLITSVSKGVYTGMQWDSMMVYWKIQGKNLLLIRPNVLYKGGKTLNDVVTKTYPYTIIRALPILSKGGGGVLVDFGRIFKSDLAGVSSIARGLLGVLGRLNSSLSKWAKVKTFPMNIELEVDLAYTGIKVKGSTPNWTDGADGERTHLMAVHYSLISIPRNNYRPRRVDDRIGYFHSAIKDFSRSYDNKSKFNRYIHRWHLEKADPSLKMSPPKKPIIFYLEKTVPYRFRKYVQDGILEWNKAFEKVGFINAVVVRQQTKTEFANLDPEDARYNFFRWVTNDFGFAAGPSHVNPLTGQILDADIIFDDSMLRYVSKSYEISGPSSALIGQDDKFLNLLKKMPGFGSEKENIFFPNKKTNNPKEAFRKVLKMMGKKGKRVCMLSSGMKHQLALASVRMHFKGHKTIPTEFLGEYVKEIVMHEVGHTLGLYHNFKASSWLPLSKINSKEKPSAIVGSVMDYNPINFTPKGIPQGHYLTTTLGPYDYWAIEYGYRSVSGNEEKMLQKIASRSGEPGHIYGNDLYASLADPDPHWIRWDLGDDPVAYAKLRIQMGKELLQNLTSKMVAKGENYYAIRRAFGAILGEYAYSNYLVAKSIGGMNIHFHHKGDPKAKPAVEVVDIKKQQLALAYLSKTIFSEKAFQFNPRLLQQIVPGTHWHWESDELSTEPIYPLHQIFLRIQTKTLAMLLNPRTLWRLQNSQLQVAKGKKAFQMAELMNGLTKSIWSEVFSGNPAKISSVRRNLQRQYLHIWIRYLLLSEGDFIPGDARVLAQKNLIELHGVLKTVIATQLDSISKAHLQRSLGEIRKALKAPYVK